MTGLVTEAEYVTKNVLEDTSDLNDLFHSITCFESNVLDEGYRQGLKDGQEESANHGFVVGFNTGSSLFLGLGYAASFCTVILQPLKSTDRPCNPYLIRLCEEIINKVKNFPKTNVVNEDLVATAEEIKIKLDKVKTVLKMHTNPNDGETVKQKFSF